MKPIHITFFPSNPAAQECALTDAFRAVPPDESATLISISLFAPEEHAHCFFPLLQSLLPHSHHVAPHLTSFVATFLPSTLNMLVVSIGGLTHL